MLTTTLAAPRVVRRFQSRLHFAGSPGDMPLNSVLRTTRRLDSHGYISPQTVAMLLEPWFGKVTGVKFSPGVEENVVLFDAGTERHSMVEGHVVLRAALDGDGIKTWAEVILDGMRAG